MRWEDQELNRSVPENKFPEVFFAGLWLLGHTAESRDRFHRIDQQALDDMIASGALIEKARGARIDRLCLYYRLSCNLGPVGDHYPALRVSPFWPEHCSR